MGDHQNASPGGSDIPKLPRCKADDENMEKLHQAARRGQTELIRRLVQCGVSVNIPNKFGCTALHLSCKHGHVGTVRELINMGANLSGMWHGRKPLTLVVLSQNYEMLDVLVDTVRSSKNSVESFLSDCDEFELHEIGPYQKHCMGQCALHYAVGLQDMKMIQQLLSYGCTPLCKDKNSETVLHRCIEFDNHPVFELMIKYVAAHPGTSEMADKMGCTALWYACNFDRVEMAQVLLTHKANPEAEDNERVTPLIVAAAHAHPALVTQMLPIVSNDTFLQLNFHNSKDVLEERIGFQRGSASERSETVSALQGKLDAINKERLTGTSTKVKQGINLAPSAPVKK